MSAPEPRGNPPGTARGGDGSASSVALPARYQLGSVIGRTIDSVRCRAVDRDTGDAVIIKSAAKPSVIQKEADILAAVVDPGVVRLRHWDTVAGGAYLVTDYVHGEPFEDWLFQSDPRPTPPTIVAVLLHLADTLTAFHASGFLHRGIRPEPIWITGDGRPILVSTDRAAPITLSIGFRRPPVRHSVFCPPEQIEETAEEGPWSDIYALSALAYWALCGEKPPSVIARRRGEPLAHLEALATRVGPAVAGTLEWGLEMDPKRRPQTIAAWQQAMTGSDPATRPAPVIPDESEENAKINVAALAPHPRPADAADGPTATETAASPRLDDAAPDRPQANARHEMRRKLASPAADAKPIAPTESGSDAIATAPRPGGSELFRLLALSVILFFCGAVLVWFGLPIYESHFKSEWVVDAGGDGDATSIGEALRRAGNGATVTVAAGTYAETVFLDRPLELRAADGGDRPIIGPPRGPCLRVSASTGSVSGFMLRAAPGQPDEACIVISAGRVQIDDNIIAGADGAAVLIRDGATPVLRDNEFVDTQGPGVVVTTGSAGSLERNRLVNVGNPGILVRGGAAPRITENSLTGGGGVIFAEGAKGWFLYNRIAGARATGIQVLSGAAPQIFDNAIEKSSEAGIFLYDHGRGIVQGNVVSDSGLSGIVIASGAVPRIAQNRITGSGEHGILVVDSVGATIENNDIRNSRGHAIAISANAAAEIRTNTMSGNREPQILDDNSR